MGSLGYLGIGFVDVLKIDFDLSEWGVVDD